MKTQKIRFLIMLFAFSLLIQGCTNNNGENTSTEGASTSAPIINYHETAEYTYRTEIEESILSTDLDPAYLLLANKDHPLEETYAPEHLVDLKSSILAEGDRSKGLKLEERTAAALMLMLEEMERDGVSDILVTSAYRTFDYQRSLYQTYLKNEQSGISTEAYAHFGVDYIRRNYTDHGLTELSPADAKAVVLSYSAYPGTSEHQTGLCVDFITKKTGDVLNESFEDTEAFEWLSENAYRFGFILRYPKEKENVTKYTYEPWHYRFVGREAATDIHFGDLTLEEYLEN